VDIFIAQMQVREGHWDNVLHSDQGAAVIEWCRQTAREFKCGFRILRLESHSCQFLLERYIGMRFLERTCKTCGTIKSFIDYFKATTAEGFSFHCKVCFESAKAKRNSIPEQRSPREGVTRMNIKLQQAIAKSSKAPLQPKPRPGMKYEYNPQRKKYIAIKEPA